MALPTPRTTLEKILYALRQKVKGDTYTLPFARTNVEKLLSYIVDDLDLNGGGGGNLPEDLLEQIQDIFYRLEQLETPHPPKSYSIALITADSVNITPVEIKAFLESFGHTVAVYQETSFNVSYLEPFDMVALSRFGQTSYHASLLSYCYSNNKPILIGYAQPSAFSIFSTFSLGNVDPNEGQYNPRSTIVNFSHPITKPYVAQPSYDSAIVSDFFNLLISTTGTPLARLDFNGRIISAIYEISDSRPIRIAFTSSFYRNSSVTSKVIIDRMIRYINKEPF